jgi:TP901 family phage tail tape measure protein
MSLDFNINARVALQGPSQAEIRNVANGVQRGFEGLNAKINIDTGGSGAALGKVTTGADAARAAVRAAREETALMNATLTGTVSLGAQSAASLENLAQQAGLAARRFVAMSVAAGVMVKIVQGFKEGVAAAIDFDLAMNKVAQTSSETSDKVAEIRGTISGLATSLGVSSKGLAEVALTAKSAGLSIRETKDALEAVALTDLTPQFGSMKETMSGLIAAYRQFGIESSQFKNTLGSINAVAAQFAVESGDLVTAVQKAGGAFKQTGGNFNEFIALVTSVRGTTRESAEEISTGLRTIFTRFQRSDTVEALRDLGVNLRYTREEANALNDVKLENQFVGSYEAVKRLSQGLATLNTTDPRYSALIEQLGGYRQISRVIPLLKQFEDAEKAKNVAIAGGISLTAAAEQRQEALANKIDKLGERYLAAFRAITQTKGFSEAADGILFMAKALAKLLESAAPLVPVIAGLAGLKIASNAVGIVQNLRSSFTAPVGASLAPKKFATGDLVPGSGTGDTVPALLTPGEFVMRREAVARHGLNSLREMNEGKRVRVQRFATGGVVPGGDDAAADQSLHAIKKLTEEQRKLLEVNFGLIEKAVQKFSRKPVIAGTVDVEGVATDALVKAAQTYSPEKAGEGGFKGLFNTILRRDIYRQSNAPGALSGGGAIDDLPLAASGLRGHATASPVDILVEREERAAVSRAVGGDLSIGSSQSPKNRGGISYEDLTAAAKGLGIRSGGVSAADLANSVADRIRSRILEQRTSEALARKDVEFIAPKPPESAPTAIASPQTSDNGSAQRFAQLNALRRDGQRAIPYSDIRSLGLPPDILAGFNREVRELAVSMGRLDAVVNETSQVVVRMKGGLAEVVGFRDLSSKADPFKATGVNAAFGVAQRIAGTPAGLDSFGGRGSVSGLPVDVIQYQERALAEARARQELNVQRQREQERDRSRTANNAIIPQTSYLASFQAQDLRQSHLAAVRRQQEIVRAENAEEERRAVREYGLQTAAAASNEPGFFSRSGSFLRQAPGRIRNFVNTPSALVERADSVFQGRGANIALGANIVAPLIAQQLDKEGNSKAARGAGGALQGAVLGATLGGTIGSVVPFIGTALGAAVGGVVGGLAGLTQSLNQAASDISKAKLDNSLTAFSDRLTAVNNAMAGGGIASPSSVTSLASEYRLTQSESAAENRRTATHTFSGFDADEFNSLQQKSDRQHFVGHLPGISQFINQQADQLGRSAPNASAKDLAEQLKNGNNGTNRDFLNLVANVRQLSPAELQKEIEKAVVSGQRARQAEDVAKASRQSQELEVNTLGRFLLAVQSSADSLGGLRDKAQALNEVFDGVVGATHLTVADKASQLGRQDRGALQAFDFVAAAGGEQGANLRRGAGVADDISRVLPGAVASAVSGHIGADSDLGTTISRNIIQSLPGIDPKNPPPEYRAAITNVEAKVRELSGGAQGEKGFLDKARVDVAKLTDELNAENVNPFKDLGGKIAEKLQDNANRFIDGLAALAARTQKVGEAQDSAANLGVSAYRTNLIIQQTRTGRQNQALDFAPLRDLEAGQRYKQERLSGEVGPRAEDANFIAKKLSDVNKQIPDAIDRQEKVGLTTGGKGPAFEAATKGLTDLKSQAVNLAAALRNLSDVSARSAEAQEKLSRFQQDREGRRSGVERFATAEGEQAAELNRGLLLAQKANQQGNFDGFIPSEIRSALDVLRSFGGATLTGFKGAPRADDLVNKLIDTLGGGAAQLGPGRAADEKSAQDRLIDLAKQGAESSKAYADALKQNSEGYFDNLKTQQQQFFERLVQELAGTHLADLQNKTAKAGIESNEASGLVRDRNRLADVGFATGGQVKTNFDEVNKYLEASSVILAQQKRVSEVEGIVKQRNVNTLGGERGLLTSFPEFDENARNRISARSDALNHEEFKKTGDYSYDANVVRAIKEELTNGSPDSKYGQAIGRQGDAFRALEGIKGFRFDKLNEIAGDPEKLKEFTKSLESFRGGQAFDNLDDKAKVLADTFKQLQDAVAATQAAITRANPPVENGPAPREAELHAAGGSIFKPRGTDTVPAMLTPGEFVVRKAVAEKHRGLLEQLNSTGTLYKADGGSIGFGWLKKAGGGLVDMVKDAGNTLAESAGYGPEGRRSEELDRQRAEAQARKFAKSQTQYRQFGGPIGISADEVERQRRIQAFADGVTGSQVAAAAEEAEKKKALVTSFTGTLPQVRDVDLTQLPPSGQVAPVSPPGAAGIEAGARKFEQNTRAERASPAPLLPPDAPMSPEAREALRFEKALAKGQGRELTAEQEAAIIDKANAESARRAERAAAAPAPSTRKAPAVKPAGLPANLDADYQAAVDPFGQSGLAKTRELAGDRAATRAYFAGQASDFNRRSRAINGPRHDFVAEAIIQSRQRYNQQAAREQNQRKPLRFAAGGHVPGHENYDSVPAMLTPGEFVLRPEAVQRAGVASLQHFNSGGPVYRAGGGDVGSSGGGGGDGGAAALAASITQLAQASAGFGQVAQQMNQAFTAFAGPAHALAEAMSNMPRTINGQFSHAVTLNHNGGEFLAKLQPEIERLVVDRVKSQLSSVLKQGLPDAGLHDLVS